MSVERVKQIKSSLLAVAPDIFGNSPVLFAYLYGSYATGLVHPFSDLDIGIYVDRLAPRARSAAVRQNARPLGRGQGELYKNVYLPYRAAKHCRKAEPPPFRAGRLHKVELQKNSAQFQMGSP